MAAEIAASNSKNWPIPWSVPSRDRKPIKLGDRGPKVADIQSEALTLEKGPGCGGALLPRSATRSGLGTLRT